MLYTIAPEEPASQEASQSSAEPFHEEECNMTEVQLLFMICFYL